MKLVTVVHPNGKKFMSLILDLIMLAIKEVMKQRGYQAGKSFDADEVEAVCSNMKEVETDIANEIKSETKAVKEKTLAIQELIKRIYPSRDSPLTFTEFIESWHEHNKRQLSGIKQHSEEMEAIYKKTAEMVTRARNLLAPNDYKPVAPPLDVIKDIAEFYESAGVLDESLPAAVLDDKLSFPWVIAQLHLVLPSIINYVNNVSFDSSDTSADELKVLKRLSIDMGKIEAKTGEFVAKWKQIVPPMIARLTKAKEERQLLEQEEKSPEELAEEALKDQMELESLKLLESPRRYFDASRDCLKHVQVKKNRLALMEDEDDGKGNLANETKIYRAPKSPYVNRSARLDQSSILGEMGPPKQRTRRRHDALEMLERATSAGTSKGRRDMNSTTMRFSSSILKPSGSAQLAFSSTMRSPDINFQLFNCSTVSSTSNSPVVQLEVPKDYDKENFRAWNNVELEKGIKSLVLADDVNKKPPKLEVNNRTITEGEEGSDASSSQTTIKNRSESNEFSFASVMLRADEDLFNISDTILKDAAE